jgi:uncharacterized protein YdhG (YjbR/CyaY superfamily)
MQKNDTDLIVPKRAFGNTGVKISKLRLGGGSFGNIDSQAFLDEALRMGVDCWEIVSFTGNVYSELQWEHITGVTLMPKYKSIDEYISAQPKKHAALLHDLRDAILEAVPDAVETFNYGVPAFALVENGKSEQQIMIAGFKNHVGMYPHLTVIEKFKKELSVFKQGKGSIQFPLNKPIPKALVVKMVKYRKILISKE